MRLEQVAWWSLLAAVFAMPASTANLTALRFFVPGLSAPFLHDETALPALSALLLALVVGLVCWGLAVSIDGRAVRWHPAWGVMLLFVALAAVSWTFSVDFSSSLFGSAHRRVGFLTLLLYASAGWLTLQMADDARRVRQLGLAAVCAATLQALYGIAQTLGLDPTDWGIVPWEPHRAFGSLGNPDAFGNYLALVLPLAIVLALTARTVRYKLVWWASSAAISIGLTLSFARGAWLGAAVGIAVLVFAMFRLQVRPDRADVIAFSGALGAAVITAALTLTGLTSYSFAERILSVLRPFEGSFETRLFIWRAALDGIAARPWTGWGPDAFVYVWYVMRPSADVALYSGAHMAEDAHSYPLQIAATLGVPAALTYATGVAMAFVSAAPAAFERGRTSRLPYAGWFAGLAGYLTALLVSITSVSATTVMWIGIAVLIAPKARTVSVSKAYERAAFAALMVAIAAVSVPFIKVIHADGLEARATQATSADQAQALIAEAALVAPWNHNYRMDLADSRLEQVDGLIDQLDGASGTAADEIRRKALGELAQAEREYADAVEEVPFDYWAASGEVDAAIVQGDLGEMAGYARGLRLADEYAARFPTDAELPLLAAYAEYRMGDVASALARFRRIQERYPDLPSVKELGAELGVVP